VGRRESVEKARNEVMRKTRKGMLTFRLVGGRRVQIRVLGVWIFRALGLDGTVSRMVVGATRVKMEGTC